MTTMVDEIYDRDYQAARAELNAAIGAFARKLGATILPALTAIHHFEWDAPWTAKAGPKAKA
jgi:hypothetical protein